MFWSKHRKSALILLWQNIFKLVNVHCCVISDQEHKGSHYLRTWNTDGGAQKKALNRAINPCSLII